MSLIAYSMLLLCFLYEWVSSLLASFRHRLRSNLWERAGVYCRKARGWQTKSKFFFLFNFSCTCHSQTCFSISLAIPQSLFPEPRSENSLSSFIQPSDLLSLRWRLLPQSRHTPVPAWKLPRSRGFRPTTGDGLLQLPLLLPSSLLHLHGLS